MSDLTMIELKLRVAAAARWIQALNDGLGGTPHTIPEAEAEDFEGLMRRLGWPLLSASGVRYLGLALRPGARPVVRCHRSGLPGAEGLYVEAQTMPRPIRVPRKPQ